MDKDAIYMREALKEALKAKDKDEVPVGCVIVHKDIIIARAHNQVETLKDPTAHAEMIAITQGAASLGSKWLRDAIVYVTIEPCLMCEAALVLARIKQLVFGAKDPKRLTPNHKFKIKSGILEKDCSFLLTEFFKERRRRGTQVG